MNEHTLTGAVALVTGASSGTGAATARRLARAGVTVALVARRRQRLEELAAAITAARGTALVVEADITDPDRAAESVQLTVDRFGRLDILVNNAGIMLLSTALHATLEDWDRMIDLNVKALLHITHAAVPYLIDAAATSPRGVADIVNVSSTPTRVACASSSVYTMTSFALKGFTEALRQEMLVERVRVSVVEPGPVSTDLASQLGGTARIAARQSRSVVEPLRPEDVAEAITYIVTRDPRVAINEMLIRASDQRWYSNLAGRRWPDVFLSPSASYRG
jgi:NADP-dependent 3-hydroxy acid dehydrogenase YdfG